MIELRVALTFYIEELSFIPDDPPLPESIIQTCGDLIEHSQDNDIVPFSHAMVQQYLKDNPDGITFHDHLGVHNILSKSAVRECIYGY